MRTLLLDNRGDPARILFHLCTTSPHLNIVRACYDAEAALRYAHSGTALELVLIDLDTSVSGGVELGQVVRAHNPSVVLVYLASDPTQFLPTFALNADMYLLKPLSQADIFSIVDRAILLSRRQNPAIFVQTFHSFEVFYGKRHIHFPNSKSKELLALCVDHKGHWVSMEDIIDLLWPGRSYDERAKKLYRKAIMDLHKVLRAHTLTPVFENMRGRCRVLPSAIYCDYYAFLDDASTQDSIPPSYMPQYSWAEETNAAIYFAAIEEDAMRGAQ